MLKYDEQIVGYTEQDGVRYYHNCHGDLVLSIKVEFVEALLQYENSTVTHYLGASIDYLESTLNLLKNAKDIVDDI